MYCTLQYRQPGFARTTSKDCRLLRIDEFCEQSPTLRNTSQSDSVALQVPDRHRLQQCQHCRSNVLRQFVAGSNRFPDSFERR